MVEYKWANNELMRCACWEMIYGNGNLYEISKLYKIPARTIGRYVNLYKLGEGLKCGILLLEKNPPILIKKYRKMEEKIEYEEDMKRRLNLSLAKCLGILKNRKSRGLAVPHQPPAANGKIF
jgi:hypothetical protein